MLSQQPQPTPDTKAKPRRGIVLVAVLVVVVLLSLAGYQYSDLMLSEYRASESAHRAVQAQKFADSGIHYAAALLSNPDNFNNLLGGNPWNNPAMFQGIRLQGDNDLKGLFDIVAPPDIDDPSALTTPIYGVQDECGKINLNALMKTDATGQTLYNMLMLLPNMTTDIAGCIVSWMGGSYGITNSGAQDDYYMSLSPAYHCKNGPIDSIDELLLVKGVTWQLLYGSDLNRNGVQEDGELGPNGFDRGWAAYLTVHSREQNSDANGNPFIYLNNTDLQTLYSSLVEGGVSDDLAKFIVMYRQYGDGSPDDPKLPHATAGSFTPDFTKTANYTINTIYDLISPLVLIKKPDPNNPGKTISTIYPSPIGDVASQRVQLPALFAVATVVQATEIPARININTAPSAVLATLPGLAATDVQNILSIRPKVSAGDAITDVFLSPGWLLTEAQISVKTLQKLDPYVTTRSQIYRVQSVGYFDGKGPAIRVEAVVDTNSGFPRILFWRNLSELGKGLINPNQ